MVKYFRDLLEKKRIRKAERISGLLIIFIQSTLIWFVLSNTFCLDSSVTSPAFVTR